MKLDTILNCDCLDLMKNMEAACLHVDLTFTSPPYEDMRAYDALDFKLKGQDWVDWTSERFIASHRVTTGLTSWVVGHGKMAKPFTWSGAPVLLQADLLRAGVKLRPTSFYRRHGVPGSGGPDWLANKVEHIVSASHGRLPWSDNTACGHPPKCRPGGTMSNRKKSGERVKGRQVVVKLANPGNVIDCGAVGGGNMGNAIAHKGDAPFPEWLCEFFIRSFCPPHGVVFDPFCGTGTTLAVAKRLGRHFIGCDIRQSEVDKSFARVDGEVFGASLVKGNEDED